jgi:hypothetical protein
MAIVEPTAAQVAIKMSQPRVQYREGVGFLVVDGYRSIWLKKSQKFGKISVMVRVRKGEKCKSTLSDRSGTYDVVASQEATRLRILEEAEVFNSEEEAEVLCQKIFGQLRKNLRGYGLALPTMTKVGATAYLKTMKG